MKMRACFCLVILVVLISVARAARIDMGGVQLENNGALLEINASDVITTTGMVNGEDIRQMGRTQRHLQSYVNTTLEDIVQMMGNVLGNLSVVQSSLAEINARLETLERPNIAYTNTGSGNELESLQTITQSLKQVYFSGWNDPSQLSTGVAITSIPNTHGASDFSQGIFSPRDQRIYFAPSTSGTTNYVYIDLITQTAQTYTGPSYSGYGGMWDDVTNRVYFAPYNHAGPWPYYDVDKGQIETYSRTNGYVGVQRGGAYSPTLRRFYMVPASATYTTLMYIDLTLVAMMSFSITTSNTIGGVYSGAFFIPTLNEIHFIIETVYLAGVSPYAGRINCDDGTYYEVTGVQWDSVPHFVAYQGGAACVNQNLFYYAPFGQSDLTNWHYIDGAVNLVGKRNKQYAHGLTVIDSAYRGGTYVPTLDRIIFAPYQQSNLATYHYIDCATGEAVAYTHDQGTSLPLNLARDATFDPINNKVWFTPAVAGTQIYALDVNTGDYHPDLELLANNVFWTG